MKAIQTLNENLAPRDLYQVGMMLMGKSVSPVGDFISFVESQKEGSWISSRSEEEMSSVTSPSNEGDKCLSCGVCFLSLPF